MNEYYSNNGEINFETLSKNKTDKLISITNKPFNLNKSLSHLGENNVFNFNISPPKRLLTGNDLIKTNEKLKEKLKIIPELESKILLLEQSEQNLKRQRHKLQMEVSELKIQIEKIKIEEDSVDESNSNPKLNDPMNKLTLKEAREIIKELLSEVEDLKKEKNELSEKALNMLTEKELANMELREQLEELNNKQYFEMNNLAKEIYKEDISRNFSLEYLSNIYNPGNQSVLQFFDDSTLMESNQLKEKLISLEKEKEDLIRYLEDEKNNNKIIISNLEETIIRLRDELVNKDYEKENYVKSINQDELNRSEIFREIESLQNNLRMVEDKHQKSELNSKLYINKLKDELNELDTSNKIQKTLNEQLNREIITLKNDFQLKLKNAFDKNKSDLAQKDKEIRNLQMKIEEYARENFHILNEYETFRKNNEINKENYTKLQDNLQEIKDNYEKEKKNYEDKIIANEKIFENEKNKLIEQLTLLQTKFNQLINSSMPKKYLNSEQRNSGMSISKFSKVLNDEFMTYTNESYTDRGGFNNFSNTMNTDQNFINYISSTPNQLATLSDCLHEDNDDSPEVVIIELQNQIEAYKMQINDLNLKITNLTKKEKEIDILKMENANLRENYDKMKNIYEEQITDLQMKNVLINAKLFAKKNSRKEITNSSNPDNSKQIINDNLIKINNLTLEIENLKSLIVKEKENYNEELKDCRQVISCLKIQLAELSYEKDTEMVKVKHENKKLKQELNRSSILNSTNNTHIYS